MFVRYASSAFFQSSGSAAGVSASESRSAFIGGLSFCGVREPVERQWSILGVVVSRRVYLGGLMSGVLTARINLAACEFHMNDEKPIPCGLCGRGFPDKDWLTKHHC